MSSPGCFILHPVKLRKGEEKKEGWYLIVDLSYVDSKSYSQ